VSWWHINYRSYIHNWVTYITRSHSPLWHFCCCLAWILRLLYITTWQLMYVTCIWKLYSWQFILLHTYLRFLYHKKYSPWYMLHAYESLQPWQFIFVTYISRVLISQKYSPFLNIYCIVPCCLTYATVMYITMLWMKFVACWCMLWMKSLRFCGVIYIKIYWHLFDIIIYYGNKAVCISWIDAKKLANNSCKPVQDCCENKNNINLP
jgi:hypothetical protein